MTLLTITMFWSSAYAKDLLFLTNGSLTGMFGQLSKIFSTNLEKDGYAPEVKITNSNCALSKMLWDQSKVPTLLLVSSKIDGLTDVNNKVCFIPVKQEQIMYWVYSTPYSFCSAGNKTWQDFITPNSTHTVAVQLDDNSVKLFNEISKAYNIKIKIVKLESSVHLIPMLKSKELDFVFWNSVSQIEDLKDKCIWTSSETTETPHGSSFLPKLNIDLNVFSIDAYIVGKNIPTQDKDKILKAIQNGWSSDEMSKIFAKRNFNNNLVSFANNKEYETKIQYLWNLIYK